jgi:ubiquinone/menaquinone biosynthesis C-methylase UbiE
MLGEGDGRFLARFATANPQASVEYVDSSSRMLNLARHRSGTGRICYTVADALSVTLRPASYDLICSHFFLDCFEEHEIELLTERLASSTRRGGQWLISEFRPPERGWRGVWAWLWLRGLYLLFGIVTGLKTCRLVDHRPWLAKNGFRLEREETSWFGLLASELWVLTDSLV